MISKTLLRGATGSLAASLMLFGAMDASAQLTLAAGPACTDFNGFLANGSAVSYVQCGGAFVGNPDSDVITWVDANWNIDLTYGGTTDPTDPPGVFSSQFAQGGTTGTLEFTGIQGVFVIALKAANQFSLYQFDTGGDTWTTLFYGTAGTATNPGNGSVQELSHAIAYLGPTSTVPEPGTVVLLLTGLASLGFVGWRRRAAAATA